MFLKSLTITHGDGTVIRDIRFHVGMNLIVDETPVVSVQETLIASGKETGNNVGKTTVLKLVDFCLGASGKVVYADHEDRRAEYGLVKNFLIENNVVISLVVKDDLDDDDSREVLIERNFISKGKQKIQRVDGQDKTDEKFEEALTDLLFPGHYGKKPTFRQIIAHNIRYTDSSTSHTLKNLDRYTRDDEYETLYLFLLGCDFEHGDAKQWLRSQISTEETFKRRLESEQTKSAYETALALLQSEIEAVERRRNSLNLNPNFEADLDKLNRVKYQVNILSSEIGRLELRRSLILEAEEEMRLGESAIDTQQLRAIYEQATSLVSGIQKTFEELNDFHNRMVESKIRFITLDLPVLDKRLAEQRQAVNRLLAEEAELGAAIIQSDSFEMLEKLIVELNTKYETKGRYENILGQLSDVDSTLGKLNAQLAGIDDELFSDEFARKIKEQVNKFNVYFSSVSYELYGEKYALKVDTKTVRGRRLYEFTAFNTNFSSGKKQGEISCFDIAYTLFADDENIPCMHFLLNDKKELMHDNQLLMIAKLVNAKGIQFVASILKDKLPPELNREEYIVVKLSQQDKLFRIENPGGSFS